MRNLAVLIAYISIMTAISHYVQINNQDVELSAWITLGYIVYPIIAGIITAIVATFIILIGMRYKWWKKPVL